MIDNKILDELLPLPSIEELKEQTIEELKEAGFVITNFASGGIFNMLLMVVLRIYIEFTTFHRSLLNSFTVTHASGAWLDLAASNYSKIRKDAIKARGYVTLSRPSAGDAIKIPKGHVFKTKRDIKGEELRFFTLEDTTLPADKLTINIEVEAEKEGSDYNVPVNQITRSLTYIEGGVDTITNAEGWLIREGSNIEDDESLRSRSLRSWSELARVPIHDTYMNICEAIPGVLYVRVEDHHPRGQGTVDIIVTSSAGAASEELLAEVRVACESIKEPDTDLLVKSSETVTQPISLTVTLPSSNNDDGLAARVEASILEMLKISKDRALNELTHADIIYHVKKDVTVVKNVTVTAPTADLFLEKDKVILPGAITVSIEGV